MKLLQAEGVPLSYVCDREPLVFFDSTNRTAACNPAYEWFYLELFSGNQHVLLILSLSDPFAFQSQDSTENVASAYATWYQNGQLQCYSYSRWQDGAALDFQKAVVQWILGESEFLELFLPDHSRESLLAIKVKRPNSLPLGHQHSSPNRTFGKTRHAWQCLMQNDPVQFSVNRIENSEKVSEFFKNHVKRENLFFDVPLARSLAKRTPPLNDLLQGHIYLDHNAGFEPLWKINADWLWWHARVENGKETVQEVGYYFPSVAGGYRAVLGSLEQPEVLTSKQNGHFKEYRKSGFAVEYPQELFLHDLSACKASASIESAPFYLRRELRSSRGSVVGTLEVLRPRVVASPVCRAMMKARQMSVSRFLRSLDLISEVDPDDICRKITRRNGKSFYAASHALSPVERRNAYLVYALCRLIDDATDSRGSFGEGAVTSREFIESIWENFHNPGMLPFLCTAIQLSSGVAVSEHCAMQFLDFCRLRVKEMGLQKGLFEELVQGQEMDERFVTPASMEGLYLYCFRVAGVVGLMMARVFRAEDTRETNLAAEHLGIAMQLTNILRDVREDLGLNRVYLPKALLAKHNVVLSPGTDQKSSDAMESLVLDVCEYALAYYQSALDGLKGIPGRRARLCVKLMIAVYGAIAGELSRNPHRGGGSRIVISSFRRFVIAIQVVLGRNPVRAAGFSGSLEIPVPRSRELLCHGKVSKSISWSRTSGYTLDFEAGQSPVASAD